jgi:hypothetical protein
MGTSPGDDYIVEVDLEYICRNGDGHLFGEFSFVCVGKSEKKRVKKKSL